MPKKPTIVPGKIKPPAKIDLSTTFEFKKKGKIKPPRPIK